RRQDCSAVRVSRPLNGSSLVKRAAYLSAMCSALDYGRTVRRPKERSTRDDNERSGRILRTYGHVHQMARAVAAGAESVRDTSVRLRRIAELEEARKTLSAQDAYVRAQQAQADIPVVAHDDLRWADGIAWGTPTVARRRRS